MSRRNAPSVAGGAMNASGGMGTPVPADEDEHMDAGVDEPKDSTDPRGY